MQSVNRSFFIVSVFQHYTISQDNKVWDNPKGLKSRQVRRCVNCELFGFSINTLSKIFKSHSSHSRLTVHSLVNSSTNPTKNISS